MKGGGFDAKVHAWAGLPATAAADFDVLSFTFVFQNPAPDLKSLKWTVGRYSMTEPTGLILDHAGDGFKLDFDYGPLALVASIGYTGLIMRRARGL